ncbi:MAG TPA: hypothetical protein VKO42_03955, partial [Patescibacteria group bacterium]|nr:hypothetical protein [Patescibacteria group bacterium]
LSSDGGKHWIPAHPGETIDFRSRPVDNYADLRWKTEFIPGENNHRSPWLDKVHIKYWTE